MPKITGAKAKRNVIITADELINTLIKIHKASYWLSLSGRSQLHMLINKYGLDKDDVYTRLETLKKEEDKSINMNSLRKYWKGVNNGTRPKIPEGFESSFSKAAPLSSSSAVAPSSSSSAAVEASMGHPVVVVKATTISNGGSRRKRRQNLTRRKRHHRR